VGWVELWRAGLRVEAVCWATWLGDCTTQLRWWQVRAGVAHARTHSLGWSPLLLS